MSVWIVDDDPIVRRVVEATLRGINVEARSWGDPIACWDHLRQTNALPSIIITDWNMPEMSGLELTRLIRDEFGDSIFVMMVTSREAEEDVLDAVKAGANDFLAKPFKLEELRAALLSLSQRKTAAAE